MSILVTGADGFIGSHLVEALIARGDDVRCMAFYNSLGSAGWLDTLPIRKNLDIVWGDVRDRDSVNACMKDCSRVIHLAALIGIPYSYESPQSYIDTNVTGALNVLQAARDLGVERIVCASTSEVYGTAQYVPMNEKHALSAQSPYAASKIASDQLALAFHRSYGLPVAIARPFNTYGPRQSLRAVIPQIITQAIAGGPISLGNTMAMRDFTHVNDTVRGIISILDESNAIGKALNIGTGNDHAILHIAGIIVEAAGAKFDLLEDQGRIRPKQSEVDRLCADASQIKFITGWHPEIEIQDGLSATIAWFRENHQLYRGGYVV